MAKINFQPLDPENLDKMVADYLRNRELGNMKIASIIKGNVLRALKAKQARKVLTFVEETLRNEYTNIIGLEI